MNLLETQIINQALIAVAIETGIVLQRSAFSLNIRDIIDNDTFFRRLYQYWITAFSGG